MIEVCPFHADEGVLGVPSGAGDGSLIFSCDRSRGHPAGEPFEWVHVPAPEDSSSETSLAEAYNLAVELPRALADYRGQWVEHGVLERAYAISRPDDFAELVAMFGHTAIAAKRYTVTSYLGRTLGELSRDGTVAFHQGPATGRWSYNSTVFWWALPPAPDWDHRLSWAESGQGMDYVPGGTEE